MFQYSTWVISDSRQNLENLNLTPCAHPSFLEQKDLQDPRYTVSAGMNSHIASARSRAWHIHTTATQLEKNRSLRHGNNPVTGVDSKKSPTTSETRWRDMCFSTHKNAAHEHACQSLSHCRHGRLTATAVQNPKRSYPHHRRTQSLK